MSNLLAVLAFIPSLNKLNEGKGKNKDEFPVLNTEEKEVEKWWNNLNHEQRVEVGGIAIHYNEMTAGCRWGTYRWEFDEKTKHLEPTGLPYLYSELPKSQQKRIKFVFSKKEENYSMFPLSAFFK